MITTTMIENGIKQALKVGKSAEEMASIDRASIMLHRVGNGTLHDWIEDQITDALNAITSGGYGAASKQVEDYKNRIISDALRHLGKR